MALAVLAAAGTAFVFRDDLRLFAGRVVDLLRTAGPWLFFSAMAILPAVGFPLLPFVLTAGVAFGPTLGTATVVACGMTALAANALLTYFMASSALRPLVLRLLTWIGWRLPSVPPGGAWQVAFIVRLMPGPPFWLQGYALGLMRIPLLPYLVGSVSVPGAYFAAVTIGGTAFLEGRGRTALLALAVLGAVAIAVRILRLRTARVRS